MADSRRAAGRLRERWTSVGLLVAVEMRKRTAGEGDGELGGAERKAAVERGMGAEHLSRRDGGSRLDLCASGILPSGLYMSSCGP